MSSPAEAINQAIDELVRKAGGGLVLLIMPRDLGKHPDSPRGHSAAWARADIVAEWIDGEFQICKGRNGSITPGAKTDGTKTQD